MRLSLVVAKRELKSLGHGTTFSELSADALEAFEIGIPPPENQKTICRYLDDMADRIQRYIRAKERLIELLEEQKQALIQQAVTGQIDVRTGRPYPGYKDSGVEWLGMIPAHWRLRRLGTTAGSVVTGTWGDEPTGGRDTLCVRVADFDRKQLSVSLEDRTMRSVSSADIGVRGLVRGDLLLEKSGGGEAHPVGQVVSFDHDVEAVPSNFIARLRVRRGSHDPRYVLYLHAMLYDVRVSLRSVKQTTGIQNLDVGAYLDERVPVPVRAEQTAIAHYLDSASAVTDRAVASARCQISVAEELRTRLISDVVTGKLDVRGMAPLPDSEAGIEAMVEERQA